MATKRKAKNPAGTPGRGFSLLTRLFPARFRDDYEDEMTAVLQAEHATKRGGWSRLGFWSRAVLDTLRSASREHLADLGADLRYAARTLRKRPLFLIVAVLSLGIGIGATATVMATISAVFLRPLPGLAHPDRLVNVKPHEASEESSSLGSYPSYRDLRESGTTLAALAGFNGTMVTVSLGRGGDPEVLPAQIVTANYFSTLGVEPLRGRFFAADEELEAHPVAVISEPFWRDRLGAVEPLPGLLINGVRFDLIGVAAPSFRGHFKGFRFDVFVPLGMAEVAGLPSHDDRAASWIEMVARLADGATIEDAEADLGRAARLLSANHPTIHRDLEIEVEPMTGLDADFRGGLVLFLATLFAISALVLVIAGLNVASMSLSREVSRRHEMAVRAALGAPRARLVRQQLTEALLLALVASGLGVLIARAATRAVSAAFASVDSRILLDVRLDPTTLLAVIVLAFTVALLSGLGPALRSSRDRQDGRRAGLRAGARAVVGGQRWRRGLVVGQVVLSFVILVSASLFLRALRAATAIDPGFDPRGVVTMSIDPDLARLEPAAASALFTDLRREVAASPGVVAAGWATRVPLSLGARFFANTLTLEVPGWQPPAGADGFAIEHAIVSEGALEALGVPVVEGRAFSTIDRGDSTPVALVNQTLAARFFPNSSVLGHIVRHGGRELEIVGVVRDAKYRTLDEAPTPFLYLPFDQNPPRRAVLLARSAGDSAALTRSARDAVRGLAPELPVPELGPLEDRLASAYLPQRVGAAAAGVLGGVGRLLCAVGLYGVLGHWVSARTAEIGLRVSLGATPRDVLRLVIRQGVVLAAIGVAVGAPIAVFASSLFRTFLYGLHPIDPPTYLLVTAIVVLAALAASALPAMRAVRVDPLVALRSE